MKAFRREGTDLVAEFDEVERRILAGVFSDTALLLGVNLAEEPSEDDALPDWDSGEIAAPADPALARLLPSSSADDEAAAEFRRFTEADIRRSKTDRLRLWFDALSSSIGAGADASTGAGTGGDAATDGDTSTGGDTDTTELRIPAATAGEWVAPMTDVRLVLASRLGVESDEDAEDIYAQLPPGPDAGEQEYSRFAMGQIYGALTWLQESLLGAMQAGDAAS